jgi:hypothetical protein
MLSPSSSVRKVVAKPGGIDVDGNEGLDFAEHDDGVVPAAALV